jgi:sulfur carrier protein ThiS
MGQKKVLQVLMPLVILQAAPPKAAVVMVERERFLVPEPQVAEHALKSDQLETLQSIGHWK